MIELDILDLGHKGDGRALGPLGEVFAPGALPGERVRVDLSGQAPVLVEVLTPSPQRIAPICPHYDVCGGCALQHAADPFVARWKRAQVIAALAARGIADVEVGETVVSPPGSRRRAVFSGRRAKKTVILGFHVRAGGSIARIESCVALAPQIMSARPALAVLTRLAATRTSEIKLTAVLSQAGLDVDVSGARPADAALRAGLAEVARDVDLARLSWNGEVVAGRRPPLQRFGRAGIVPSPGAFLQATRQGEAALSSFARAGVAGAARVADLFAGCGALSAPLAETAEVHAVEAEAAALAALDAGWRKAEGLKRLTTEARDLFRRPLLAAELNRFDAVVFDPPRAGARAQAEQIAQSTVARVVAISCNPATFARDARALIDGGYALRHVSPVDQFRWSPHVELAALFER